MIRNSKVTGKATSVPIGLLAGLLMSLLITVSCSAVLAIMMVGGGLSIRSIGWWALIVVWLSYIRRIDDWADGETKSLARMYGGRGGVFRVITDH